MLINVSVYGQDADPESQWQSLNALAMESYRKGKHTVAIEQAQRALKFANEHLKADHPDTLVGMNNLAFLHKVQTHYEEAEQLYVEVLKHRTVSVRPRPSTKANESEEP